ncbi:MAG: hypothetical protein E7265_07460 [Lachnospiraceae bacterium]|nr:hypothetical protein [Lachnospiraceae bacterium]
MGFMKKIATGVSLVVAFSIVAGQVNYSDNVNAKAKPKLNNSKKVIVEGKSFVLKASGVKKVKWSVANKKIAKLKNIKKKSVKVVAAKKGTTKVVAKYSVGKKTKKMQCRVVVKAKRISAVTASPIADSPSTTSPSGNNQVTATATVIPTKEPSPTPVPTAIPTPSVVSETGSWEYIPCDNDSLLKEYGEIFGNVGTCLTYDVLGKRELQDADTMKHVRDNYNSFTLENEMKPSYILADPSKDFRNPEFNRLISCEEAKEQGYIIPEGYEESDVPALNLDTIDKIMQVAKDNGIRMRGHVLIWHSQTPINFFKEGYNKDGAFVSSDVMDQRVIYYVTNVMKHICESPNRDVIYSWDIVNEYFHQHSDGTDENWSKIYDIGYNASLSTRPTYAKLSFKIAHDILKEYGMRDEVTLFYNDYNTSQVADKIVAMVNYFNEADDINPEGEKICNGVGMQCHLGLKWPTVGEQLDTAKKFLDAGFEIQITELDIVNDNESSDALYCEYWFQFMKGLVEMRMSGSPITGVTFWGLSDSVSWRWGQSALLYGKSINDPKKALYAAYAAAQLRWNLK